MVLANVRNPGRPHHILASALAARSPYSLFERIQMFGGLGGGSPDYNMFFSVYSIVNGACQEARHTDPSFFSMGAKAICESLEDAGIWGCELIVGILYSLEATVDRIMQLNHGIAEKGATGRVKLRLTLIRGADGHIPDAQFAACERLVEAGLFPSLASSIVGFDISGREKATTGALEQLRRLVRLTKLAEDRSGKAFTNTIHLGERLTKPEKYPADFYLDLLEEVTRWRIVHGLQFWHPKFLDTAQRVRSVIAARQLEFDICPSASQLIHQRKINFRRLETFCKETETRYAICSDNPSLLTTNVRQETTIFHSRVM
ncbi:hypothetical protein WNZ14_14220 [Hoeflea sp. AS60]|uniref:hypothetical protein n=1 Tax=Hoeflea sp. AS60 TaxID=3135780 RepID=UPI0031736031